MQSTGTTHAIKYHLNLGKSIIKVDVPNGPCDLSNPEGCAPAPAGLSGGCPASSLSTADTNLEIRDDGGLNDLQSDVAADATNTFEFTVNLSDCLANGQGGPIAWEVGESPLFDIAFGSQFGDNAAQKICISRAPATEQA